ncbi:CDC14-domain-containing protein [Punctularia strigosozonata HHB-11173 SS5]|uniref:CDC14-domain-containing protein n=1 Tax=Punctularia strigosozonata (strain HHB-11173) TaxID=741275 RepID=UPI00044176F8|nr:CDC14-domain-containing protein [Punctularia strigosozonata HHB-11173 SS5]EIN10961.1 CDC14-domain-containing protein [Punctularia strigosozonata HHB-11173 SS5]
MHATIQDALDEIVSSRSSDTNREKAIGAIEQLLASVSALSRPNAGSSLSETHGDARLFWALQDTFECNIPSHLLPWISTSVLRLESLIARAHHNQDSNTTPTAEKGSNNDYDSQITLLALNVSSVLNIVQGLALCHNSSKRWLGRRANVGVLVDLMLISRHIPPAPSRDVTMPADAQSRRPAATPALTSMVLDTLLCVLVDAPPAIRAFEACNGIQAVVKILKRSGTAREVRMKCLEFLYFYLMDETNPSATVAESSSTADDLQQVLQPRPGGLQTPKVKTEGRRVASSGSLSSATSLSSSGSDDSSTSATSLASSDGSVASTPKPACRVPSPTSPFAPNPALFLLKREVDYVPLSPARPVEFGKDDVMKRSPLEVSLSKSGSPFPPSTPLSRKRGGIGLGFPGGSAAKAASSRSGSAAPGHRRGESMVLSRTASRFSMQGGPFTPGHRKGASLATAPLSAPNFRKESCTTTMPSASSSASSRTPETRTTEEKKELLGGLLGNVDALVEGVRKAGVWGLG